MIQILLEVAEFVEELQEDCEVDHRQRQQEQDAPHHWRYHQLPAAPLQVEPDDDVVVMFVNMTILTSCRKNL